MNENFALVFPGQGTQFIGMGKYVYDLCEDARTIFKQANKIMGYDITSMCFEGTKDELAKTINTQPAIFTVSYASYIAFNKVYGYLPKYMAGHSLGELTAVICAGGLSYEAGLMLVKRRGELMQSISEAIAGKMTAINGIDEWIVDYECQLMCDSENFVGIACYNSTEQVVISGHESVVNSVSEKLKRYGARVISLNNKAPFHTTLMKSIAEKWYEELQASGFHKLWVPVLSNVDGRPYVDVNKIINNLYRQLYMPVRWKNCMDFFEKENVDFIIEMSPGSMLKNINIKHGNDVRVYAIDVDRDRRELRCNGFC